MVPDHFLDVQMSFRVAGARDCAPGQKWAKRGDFVAFRVAGTVQRHMSQTCLGVRVLISCEGLHFGASHRQVCSDGHFVGFTCSWQTQYIRQMEWKKGKAHWHEAVSSAFNFPSWRTSHRIASFLMILMLLTSTIEEVSQDCFFLTLSSSEIEDVSQNSSVFAVIKCKNWGSLAE